MDNDQTIQETRYDEGLRIRREVLGAAHVDRSLATATEFSRAVQDMTVEYCWGYAWSRPGLDRRTRSLLNLVMLTALNRSAELRLHVRGAITNGATPEEIQEALLQATVYCGVPAGLEAFRTANEVLVEMGLVARPEAPAQGGAQG